MYIKLSLGMHWGIFKQHLPLYMMDKHDLIFVKDI